MTARPRRITARQIAPHLALIALVLTAALAAGWASAYGNEQTRTCTVTERDRTTVVDEDGYARSQHRIYTQQCGVLEVRDVALRWQHASADTYAALQPGHTYELTTVGWRIPLLSSFPVVVDTPREVTP